MQLSKLSYNLKTYHDCPVELIIIITQSSKHFGDNMSTQSLLNQDCVS